MAEQVLHAYGVVPGGALRPSERGIADTSVELLPLGELAVVVGRLPADEYGEEIWARHGEDPRWLQPVAVGHHRVLQELVERGDVLPLRLPGMYADEQALRRAVDGSTEMLAGALARVAGHAEWSGHVFGAAAGAAVGGTGDHGAERPRSGRDYLERKARSSSARRHAQERRRELLARVHETLREAAADAVVNDPQDPALSGREEPMLLNAAYLVQRAEEERFFAAAERVARELGDDGAGLTLEVRGPWPAYNFTDAGGRP